MTEEQSRSKFPSPRGDKLCPGIMAAINESMKQFPSPRGDKLCLIAIFEKNLKTFLFPSPRGDKLCHLMGQMALKAKIVSVPSRG